MRIESFTAAIGCVCALWAIGIGPACAQPLPFEPGTDVAFDQKLGGNVPAELQFRDEAGRQVILGDYFQDRPVLLLLIQYRCPMLCDLTLEGAVRSLKALALDPGRDFQVLVVSFDSREGPSLARKKRETTLRRYARPDTESGWHFLTGPRDAIEPLTRAVGFRYFYDEQTDQYAHPAGLVVLTPQGRISRYFPGVNPPARDLRLGLVEASRGRIGTLADRMLLLCYAYDPVTGRYGFAIITAVRVGGALTVLGLAAGVIVLLRRERRQQGHGTSHRERLAPGSRLSTLDWSTDHGPRTTDLP